MLILRTLRVHHWTKNFLVFIPILMGHEANDLVRIRFAALAFAAFCLASSATYIFNDLMDVEHDRAHRSKRNRPLSANEISPRAALMIMIVCALGSIAIAWAINFETLIGIALYLALSTLYTLLIKRILIADVIVLASFYSLRVLVGGAATAIVVSRWLLAFSSFLFVSLALAKRYADLTRAEINAEDAPAGRGYATSDRQVLLSLGTASGMISVLVFALYLNSPQVTTLYSNTDPLWLVCALLMYWIGRIWLLADRGLIDDDPIVTAATDPASYVVAAAAAAIVMIAI
ncbi:MAG: UbiA family prenyltransferase [Acidobacteriota bacterium]